MFKSKTKTEQVRDQVRDHAKDLADKLAPHVENARDIAGPVIADARSKAAPVVSDARNRLNTEVLPAITAAVAAATEASEPYVDEAKKRGAAASAALKGEVSAPKKKHRVRRFLGLIGLAGIAALVAKSFSDRQATTAWQSSYEPTPAAPPASAPASAAGKHVDDEAASSPDEAFADAAETPHATTDPDHPAEEINLKKD